MGGGTVARKVDQVDYVRAASIRGHLRFWWRAIRGGDFASATDLYAAESQLWGGVHGQPVIRSAVEIACVAQPPGEEPERTDVTPNDPHAYALWPAREERREHIPPAERWRRLAWAITLRVPQSHEPDVRRALHAWILFGGYGGRTRRGCGSLDVVVGGKDAAREREEWLPREASMAEIERVLGEGVLGAAPRPSGDLPLLARSRLYTGDVASSADAAWATALQWLRAFRQEPALTASDDDFPREPLHGPDKKQRPGPSRWPEADKLRHLAGSGPWAHAPRHNDQPVWPRAGFGLPVITRFQQKDASGEPYRRPDPREQYELVWQRSGEDKPHDRLASPLILKPLALADGRFVPIALWLHRGYPAGGEVVARQGRGVLPGSAADFDVLTAPGDTPLYRPLQPTSAASGERLKTAFFDWLVRRYPTVRRLV